jgi:hypothetical protein
MRAVLRLIKEQRGACPRALTLGLLLAAASSAMAGPAAQSPTRLEVDSLPEPPRQRLAWEPPRVSLPEKLVTATARLFKQGLADPRGCEYREVEVASGNVGGWVSRIKTHAWVLPAAPQPGGRRFAVGWNGLVYPLERVGEKADLRQDVLALIEEEERRRVAGGGRGYSGFYDYGYCHSTPNGQSVSHQQPMLIKVAMLLRLGEGELTRKVWGLWTEGARVETNIDPYMLLACEWTWALFDRALIAHAIGDDRLALLSARSLVPIRDAVESAAASRQLPPPDNTGTAPGVRPLYLPFLKPLPSLLADQERRAREGRRGEPSLRDRLKNPRVAATLSVEELIRNLDDTSAALLGRQLPQLGQPDALSFDRDAVVVALIEKGEQAVEPLLRVLEDDTRLIRTFRPPHVHSIGLAYRYERRLIGVHEAAYAALSNILLASPFWGVTPYEDLMTPGLERRRALAARIRLYLKQYGSLSPEERRYRALADDGATIEQWRQAAAWIATPGACKNKPTQWAASVVYYRRKGQNFSLCGEALRQKAGPSVSQLLVRRIDDSLARLADKEWVEGFFGVQDFVSALSAWDGANALGELRRVTALLERRFASEPRTMTRRSSLRRMILGLYSERLALDDPQAVAGYASWLRTLRPEDTDYGEYDSAASLFDLACRYAGSPEIVEAVTRMFGDPASPWGPVIGRLGNGSNDTLQLLETRLLGFPAFRARVLEGLADRTVVGTLKPSASEPAGTYDLKVENLLAKAVAGDGNVTEALITFPDFKTRPPAPPPAPFSIRACDVYAWKLRGFEGSPWIELYWTEAERDAAVAASVKWLREHGGPFVYSETRAYRRL